MCGPNGVTWCDRTMVRRCVSRTHLFVDAGWGESQHATSEPCRELIAVACGVAYYTCGRPLVALRWLRPAHAAVSMVACLELAPDGDRAPHAYRSM